MHVLYALYWNTDAKVFIKKNCFDTSSQLTENVRIDSPIFSDYTSGNQWCEAIQFSDGSGSYSVKVAF